MLTEQRFDIIHEAPGRKKECYSNRAKRTSG